MICERVCALSGVKHNVNNGQAPTIESGTSGGAGGLPIPAAAAQSATALAGVAQMPPKPCALPPHMLIVDVSTCFRQSFNRQVALDKCVGFWPASRGDVMLQASTSMLLMLCLGVRTFFCPSGHLSCAEIEPTPTRNHRVVMHSRLQKCTADWQMRGERDTLGTRADFKKFCRLSPTAQHGRRVSKQPCSASFDRPT